MRAVTPFTTDSEVCFMLFLFNVKKKNKKKIFALTARSVARELIPFVAISAGVG